MKFLKGDGNDTRLRAFCPPVTFLRQNPETNPRAGPLSAGSWCCLGRELCSCEGLMMLLEVNLLSFLSRLCLTALAPLLATPMPPQRFAPCAANCPRQALTRLPLGAHPHGAHLPHPLQESPVQSL